MAKALRIKIIYQIIYTMHPQIEAALTKANTGYPIPNAIALKNAEKLLNYIEDLNLERPGKFMPTQSQGFYILWSVEDWEFHMECIKTGRIIYIFSKAGHEQASGSYTVDEFISQLERYLLIGMG